MSTPHNSAKPGDIAKKVLMPGDPLRAKYIADTFLENPVCFNKVRNMLGYTGTYKGEPVSVMGGGMGIPSTCIYAHELFNVFDVDKIIRVGSTGALSLDLHLRDIVIAMGACTDSNFISQYKLPGHFAPIASYPLLKNAVDAAEKLNVPVKVGNILSSDVFYTFDSGVNTQWRDMGCLCVEMETAGLYATAAASGKQALTLLTVSDHLFLHEYMEPEDRQKSFKQMMEIALEI